MLTLFLPESKEYDNRKFLDLRMSQETNHQGISAKIFFQNVASVIENKDIYPTTIFRDIAKHFQEKGRAVGESTLAARYKIYNDEPEELETEFSVSGTTYTELNKYLISIHADVLRGYFKFNDYDYHFLYYYQGSEDYIKPAIMCFKDDNGEFGDGVIYYLSKGDEGYNYRSTFELKRLVPVEGARQNPNYIFYRGISNDFKDQVNTFSINISTREASRRFLFFLSCNAISNMAGVRVISTNFGVVKRVDKDKLREEIKKTEIDPWISNALIGKKAAFEKMESTVFTTERGFTENRVSDHQKRTTNLQYTCSNILKSFYLGIYLRNEIESGSSDKGGIALAIMDLQEDGNATINFARGLDEGLAVYYGVFRFPYDKYKVIRGDFQQEKTNVYRYSMFLNLIKNSKNLGGVFSGFKDFVPFVSPIIFYKVDDKNKDLNLSFLLEKIKSGSKSKHDALNHFREIFDEDSDEYFKKIFKKDGEAMLATAKKDLIKIAETYYEKPDTCFL